MSDTGVLQHEVLLLQRNRVMRYIVENLSAAAQL